jgi:hypothetical protein
MFIIPQANAMSPDLAGVNSITTAHSGERSFDVQRRKYDFWVARLVGYTQERDAAGMPARMVNIAGS